jgi:hypothetical protein
MLYITQWMETLMTLDDYFKLIVKPTEKEPTMFDWIKAKWTELMTTPIAFTDEPTQEIVEEGWAFIMKTGSYVDETGEVVPTKEDIIAGDSNGTWMETLDQLLDIMSKHYGYDIKEQVYYSVHYPLNIEGEAGYGRCLNDEVLQKLLLSYPEVYEAKKHDWLVQE